MVGVVADQVDVDGLRDAGVDVEGELAGGGVAVGGGGDVQRVVLALLELVGELEEDGVLEGVGRLGPFVGVAVDLGLAVDGGGAGGGGVGLVVGGGEGVAGGGGGGWDVERGFELLEDVAAAGLVAHEGAGAFAIILVLDDAIEPVDHEMFIVNRADFDKLGAKGGGAHSEGGQGECSLGNT